MTESIKQKVYALQSQFPDADETSKKTYKLLRTHVRGLIGIRKGLGLEEVDIKFSKPSPEVIQKFSGQPWFDEIMNDLSDTAFEPGLIVITGANGKGKTTFLENAHFFRTMVSQDGSLKDQFYLKHSFRYNWAECDGDIYVSMIKIDALVKSGSGEAYLYKNGKSLNDGKVSTYDEILRDEFGSESLFFNSTFAGQKSKGYADLEISDRRKLFYELRNLIKYDPIHDECNIKINGNKKKKIEGLLDKLAGIEGSICSLTEDVPNADELEQQRIKHLNEQAEITAAISDMETEIENCEKQLRETEINIATSQEKLKGNEDLEKKIKLISDKIDSATKDHKSKLIRFNSEVEDNSKLIDRNKKLLENKEVVAEKLQLIKDLQNDKSEKAAKLNKINNEIHAVQEKYFDKQKNISASEKILNQKRIELNELINRKDNLNNKLADLSSGIEEIQSDIEFKNSYLQEPDNKPLLLNDGSQENAALVKLADTFNYEFNSIAKEIIDFEYEIEKNKAIKKEIILSKIISLKEKVYSQPAFDAPLQNLMKLEQRLDKITAANQDKLTELKIQFERISNEYSGLVKTITPIEIEVKNLEKDVTKNKQMSEEELEINSSEYKSEAKKVTNAIADIDKQLTDLQKTDWEKLSKEADHAENNIKLLQQKLETAKSSIKESNKTFDEYVFDLKADASEAQNKLDLELPKKISELEDTLDFLKGQLFDLNSALTNRNNALDTLEISIKEIDMTLEQLKNTQKRIDELNEQRKNIQQEITDWTLLANAFDKTGIPVLKMENSGPEITSLVNELLAFYEKDSRVILETTVPKADKSGYKESFEITCIDNHNIPGIPNTMEVKRKSGGERVWYNTAIQSAISIFQNQEQSDSTVFFDEQDGALDSLGSTYKFLEMLQKAHELTKAHQTILITHRQELIDMIPQRITFNDGYVKIEN